jgi:hypothetical protein
VLISYSQDRRNDSGHGREKKDYTPAREGIVWEKCQERFHKGSHTQSEKSPDKETTTHILKNLEFFHKNLLYSSSETQKCPSGREFCQNFTRLSSYTISAISVKVSTRCPDRYKLGIVGEV